MHHHCLLLNEVKQQRKKKGGIRSVEACSFMNSAWTEQPRVRLVNHKDTSARLHAAALPRKAPFIPARARVQTTTPLLSPIHFLLFHKIKKTQIILLAESGIQHIGFHGLIWQQCATATKFSHSHEWSGWKWSPSAHSTMVICKLPSQLYIIHQWRSASISI